MRRAYKRAYKEGRTPEIVRYTHFVVSLMAGEGSRAEHSDWVGKA